MNINENCLPEGDLKQKSLVTGRIITIFLLGSTNVTEVYIFFEKSPNLLANEFFISLHPPPSTLDLKMYILRNFNIFF